MLKAYFHSCLSILAPEADAVKLLSGLNLRGFRALTPQGTARIIGRRMSDQLRDLIDSVRTRLHADLDAQLGTLAERHEQAVAELRTKHGLLEAIREIDAAQSISDALTAIVRASAHEAPRAALFVGSVEPLEEWVVDEAPSMSDRQHAAVAIPLLLDGKQVAILYGDPDNKGIGLEGWRDGLAVIASHGASRLACITATRTAQAMRWFSGGLASPTSAEKEAALKGWTTPATVASVTSALPPSSDEEEQAARRYARLLLSEIKLYNESAVRAGREQRDLAVRLAPDIDRARHLYEQRIPATLPGRAELFHNELVQTIAGGDGSLLG